MASAFNDQPTAQGAPPRGMKAMGIMMIVIGSLLLPSGVALLLLVLPMLDYTGTLRLLVQAVLWDVVVIGAAGFANGVHMVRHGRQNTPLRIIGLLSGLAFIGLLFTFNTVYHQR